MGKPLLLVLKEKIESEKVKELYYRENPSYTSATLSDSITNYDLILIIGQSLDGYACSGILYKPSVGGQVSIKAGQVNSNKVYDKEAVFKFSQENVVESIQNYEIRDNVPYSGVYIRIKAVLGINF